MSLKPFRYILLLVLMASLSACLKNDVDDDYKSLPYEVYDMSVPEPSDLCLNFSATGLFAISDQGMVFEIGFNGATIRKLTQYTNPSPSTKDDIEGVCIDPVAKNIFVVNERSLRVSRLDENGKYLDSFTIPSSALSPQTANDGVEGITLNGDTFYFVNQLKPRVLLSYNRITQKWSSQIPLDFCLDVNAISYDATDNTLWILSSQSHRLYQCSISGKPIKVLNVSFITQPEGVWVDRTNKVAYICCDKSKKLYKASLNNLQDYE